MYISFFNMFATNLAVCMFAVSEIDIEVDNEKTKAIVDLFLPQIY